MHEGTPEQKLRAMKLEEALLVCLDGYEGDELTSMDIVSVLLRLVSTLAAGELIDFNDERSDEVVEVQVGIYKEFVRFYEDVINRNFSSMN